MMQTLSPFSSLHRPIVMRTASVLLLFALSAAAQSLPEAEAARARRLLNSPDYQEKAWGAYFAGRLHSSELQEPIVDAFREAYPLRHTEHYLTPEFGYLSALFDAAIESGITVPAGLLEPFDESWAAPVIILLARDPKAEESLLRMREGKLSSSQWLAAGNLLLGLKSERFFAKTLSEVRISHDFTLTDPGYSEAADSGMGGGGVGDGIGAMPAGFPPIAIYAIVNSPQKGDVLLADGPQNAYYRRFVVPTGKQVGINDNDSVDRQKVRVGYLARLGNLTDSEADRLFHRHTHIEVQNEANLRQQWEAALTSQESAIRGFVRTAQNHGMGSVTGMHLQILIQVTDLRKMNRGPAPPPAPHEFTLE